MKVAGQDGSFKGRHFTSEVILWALRWSRLASPRLLGSLASCICPDASGSLNRGKKTHVSTTLAEQELVDSRPTTEEGPMSLAGGPPADWSAPHEL